MTFELIDNPKRFSTADLPLAQFLVAHGYEPTITLLNERFCSFEFPTNEDIEQLVAAYQRGEALVEPRQLKAAEWRTPARRRQEESVSSCPPFNAGCPLSASLRAS